MNPANPLNPANPANPFNPANPGNPAWNSNGPIELPGGFGEWPDPWTTTNTETRQQCDTLPSGQNDDDQCERDFRNRRQTCHAWSGRGRALCQAAARVRYWLCKGAETFRIRPDDFDGGGPSDGPNLTGF